MNINIIINIKVDIDIKIKINIDFNININTDININMITDQWELLNEAWQPACSSQVQLISNQQNSPKGGGMRVWDMWGR